MSFVTQKARRGQIAGPIKAWRLFVISLLCKVLPETRMFGFKTTLYRWTGVRIGRNVRICSSAKILGAGPLEIGDDVWIGPETMIVAVAPVTLGSHIDIAPRVYIGTGTHEIDPLGPHSAGTGRSLPVTIADGVWIGVGATLTPGISIGQKAVIAAGAVVIADIPPRFVVGGVPARCLRELKAPGGADTASPVDAPQNAARTDLNDIDQATW